jgi:PAS domain S-box-containing protein
VLGLFADAAWRAWPYSLLLVISAALGVAIAVVVWRRRPAAGAAAFTWLMLASAEWSAMAAIEHAAVDPSTKILCAKLEYPGIISVAPLWLAFALAYTERRDWLTRARFAPLWLVPVVTVALAFTNEWHGLIWTRITSSSALPGAPLVYGHGAWFWVAAAYSYMLNVAATVTLVASIVHLQGRHWRAMSALLAGAAMPWVGNAIYLAGGSRSLGMDPTPMAFALTGVIYAFNVFRLQLFDVVPVARHLLVDSMTDGVLVLDVDNRVADINAAARRMLGVGDGDVLRRPATAALAMWPDVAARYRDVRDTRAEVRVETGSGTHYIDLRITSLHDRRGRYRGRLVVFGDVTERKRTEQALQQNEKLASLGELLAGVAHELNNPLAVIVGHATLLLRTELANERAVARVEKIATAAERCGRIVRNFLTVARQRVTERAATDVNRVLRDAVDFLAYQLALDDVAVSFELAPEIPPLWADGTQIHQVALNLLINAQHAMRATGGPRRITIASRWDPAAEHVTFSIADSGPGVPAELRSRIFEPFFTTKPVGAGSGLGLSVCRGIVATHHGSIEVHDAPGGGALFVVHLPLSAPSGEERAARPAPVPPVRGKRVLVVDDEPMVAELLGEMLVDEGHRIETAANGQEALDRLEQGGIDLVITDVRMPVLDGRALYQRLHESPPANHPPLIFITGDTLNVETRRFLQTTGAPTLSKPFDPDVVRAVVRAVLTSVERSTVA